MPGRPFTIELGSKVRDRVTGFAGIAQARMQWLTGCNRYGVQPPVGKDGKIPEMHYFDEHALEVVQSPASKLRRALGALGAEAG